MRIEMVAMLIMIVACALFIILYYINKTQNMNSLVIKHIKEMKELYKISNTVIFTSNGKKAYCIVIAIVILFLDIISVRSIIITPGQEDLLLGIVKLIAINLMGGFIILYLFMKTVDRISIRGANLVVATKKEPKEYKIETIESFKYRFKFEGRMPYLYFYIKSKDTTNIEECCLYYDGSMAKLKAFMLLVKYIRNNNVEFIDILSETDIENEIKDFEIMN